MASIGTHKVNVKLIFQLNAEPTTKERGKRGKKGQKMRGMETNGLEEDDAVKESEGGGRI